MSRIAVFIILLGVVTNSNTEKYKVLVTHPKVPVEAIALLSRSTDVIICDSLLTNRTEILEKSKGVHALMWASYGRLDADILDAIGPQLKVVSTVSAGYNSIDVEELKKRSIPLGNTPKVLSGAVADVAMGLMLSAARRFHEGREKIESASWDTTAIDWMFGQDIEGATVGFYGFGNIGIAIAKRLMGFDIAEILYTTRTRVDTEIEKNFNAKKVDFPTMVATSDIIFVAAPLTNETVGVFDKNAFSKMKKSAIFVNIARGKIVNQSDLVEALKTNQIFAAGLDVTDPEPLAVDDPILSLPNCVISPHIGSATKRTRTKMAILAANNILAGLSGNPLPAAVY